MIISALHPSNLELGIDRGKLYDYKKLFHESIDAWVKDQNKWGACVEKQMIEINRLNAQIKELKRDRNDLCKAYTQAKKDLSLLRGSY